MEPVSLILLAQAVSIPLTDQGIVGLFALFAAIIVPPFAGLFVWCFSLQRGHGGLDKRVTVVELRQERSDRTLDRFDEVAEENAWSILFGANQRNRVGGRR